MMRNNDANIFFKCYNFVNSSFDIKSTYLSKKKRKKNKFNVLTISKRKMLIKCIVKFSNIFFMIKNSIFNKNFM